LNAGAIVGLETQKLAAVDAIIQLKTTSTSGDGESGMNPTDPVYQETGTGGGTSWLWILGLAAGAWFVFGKPGRRKNQVATRKKTKR